MNKLLIFGLNSLFMAVPLTILPAFARTPSTQDQSDSAYGVGVISSDDFIDQASAMGNAEVSAAHMALEKSSSPAVKAFAQAMLKDHRMVNQRLVAMASRKGLQDKVSINPDAKDVALGLKMKMETGSTFDRSYAIRQVTAHQEAIAIFQREAQSGSDPDLKQLAEETLPTLEQHLKMARELAEKTGVPVRQQA